MVVRRMVAASRRTKPGKGLIELAYLHSVCRPILSCLHNVRQIKLYAASEPVVANMVSPTALAVAAVLILFCLLKAIGLKRNIREARQIGLPYIIVPFNLVSISWALLSLLLLPVFKRLPEQWTTPWLP